MLQLRKGRAHIQAEANQLHSQPTHQCAGRGLQLSNLEVRRMVLSMFIKVQDKLQAHRRCKRPHLVVNPAQRQ